MASTLAESRTKKALASTGHNMEFIPIENDKPLCRKCQTCVHRGQTVPDQCTTCGKHRGTWRCLKCLLHSRSRLDTFWAHPCRANDPLNRTPALSGQRSTGGDSFRATDLDNYIATEAAYAHLDITGAAGRIFTNIATCGIQGLDPRNLNTSVEQQGVNEYRRNTQTGTPIPTVSFVAIGADGQPFMQEAAETDVNPVAKARPRPVVSAFLPAQEAPRVTPPPDPGSQLTVTQAATLLREERRIQRQLTLDLKHDLRNDTYAAAHCSGTAPVFLHRNDIENVKVGAEHPWANHHYTHDVWRADLTVFCRKGGSCQTTYDTTVMREPCKPAKSQTGYRKLMLGHLLNGDCPYKHNWPSGLAKHHKWPPVPLWVSIEDDTCHTNAPALLAIITRRKATSTRMAWHT